MKPSQSYAQLTRLRKLDELARLRLGWQDTEPAPPDKVMLGKGTEFKRGCTPYQGAKPLPTT